MSKYDTFSDTTLTTLLGALSERMGVCNDRIREHERTVLGADYWRRQYELAAEELHDIANVLSGRGKSLV